MIHDCVCQSCQSTQPPEMYGEVAYCSECGLLIGADFLWDFAWRHERTLKRLAAGMSATPDRTCAPLTEAHKQKIAATAKVTFAARRAARRAASLEGKEVVDVELGKRLKEHRVERKLTQRQLADLAGFNVALVARIEFGRARYLNEGDLDKLADALGVPVDELQHNRKLVAGRYVKVV